MSLKKISINALFMSLILAIALIDRTSFNLLNNYFFFLFGVIAFPLIYHNQSRDNLIFSFSLIIISLIFFNLLFAIKMLFTLIFSFSLKYLYMHRYRYYFLTILNFVIGIITLLLFTRFFGIKWDEYVNEIVDVFKLIGIKNYSSFDLNVSILIVLLLNSFLETVIFIRLSDIFIYYTRRFFK